VGAFRQGGEVVDVENPLVTSTREEGWRWVYFNRVEGRKPLVTSKRERSAAAAAAVVAVVRIGSCSCCCCRRRPHCVPERERAGGVVLRVVVC